MSNISDTQPIHPLRQRMIEDMTLRGLSAPSQKAYIRAVRRCSEHLGVRPADLTADHARAFLLHLQSEGLGVTATNAHATALRFFLHFTLGRYSDAERVPPHCANSVGCLSC